MANREGDAHIDFIAAIYHAPINIYRIMSRKMMSPEEESWTDNTISQHSE
jgi:hypothetical protein